MKKNDTFPVMIGGSVVGQAVVSKVDSDRVTLVVPAMEVVMGYSVQLESNTGAPEPVHDETATSTVITGVDRVNDNVEVPVANEHEKIDGTTNSTPRNDTGEVVEVAEEAGKNDPTIQAVPENGVENEVSDD